MTTYIQNPENELQIYCCCYNDLWLRSCIFSNNIQKGNKNITASTYLHFNNVPDHSLWRFKAFSQKIPNNLIHTLS